MSASADGAAFFMMWKSTRRPMSPLAASADTNSIDRISRTLALTRRLTTPIGMSERVMTGRIRCLACSHVHGKPSGPMPWPGSTLSTTAKVATSTMPTQYPGQAPRLRKPSGLLDPHARQILEPALRADEAMDLFGHGPRVAVVDDPYPRCVVYQDLVHRGEGLAELVLVACAFHLAQQRINSGLRQWPQFEPLGVALSP